MKTNKVVMIVLIIALFAITFTACNDESEQEPEVNELLESAVFFDRGEKILRQDYIDTLRGIDELFVKRTTVLVDNEQTLDTMFVGFPTSVDFETERIIVFIFTSHHYGCPAYLDDIRVENGECNISIVRDFEGRPTNIPMGSFIPRALVVKVKTTDIDSSKITLSISSVSDYWHNV